MFYEVMGVIDQRYRQACRWTDTHRTRPLLTLVFNHDGYVSCIKGMDGLAHLSHDGTKRTIHGFKYTIDPEQKELFRVVER